VGAPHTHQKDDRKGKLPTICVVERLEAFGNHRVHVQAGNCGEVLNVTTVAATQQKRK
jgi:hypothetical protein